MRHSILLTLGCLLLLVGTKDAIAAGPWAATVGPDLTAIEALSGTSGILTKTAENTWALDTSTPLTVETDPSAEPALGNPSVTGYVLSSTTGGSRSWVASGTGDVVGPASATDSAPVCFDTTTGKLIKGCTTLAVSAIDMGSGIFELPNGTSGTTDATGEVYFDTDGDGGTNFSGPVVQLFDGSANKFLFPMALPLAASQDNFVPRYDASAKTVQWETTAVTDEIVVAIDGHGTAIATGVVGYFPVEFAATIIRATLLCDQTGSIVVDLWKDTYANYPPTVTDTITASAKPTVSAAVKAQDATLTGWTTSITAGDVLGLNVDSATTVEYCTLTLRVTR